jgi:HPt (histidine-containing phosphotransfer) domain-containing protein
MAVDSVASEPILDSSGALSRLGGDRELYRELSTIVLEDVPRVLTDLQRAVAAKNPDAIRAHAHAIKGLAAGCGGVRATGAAQALEDAGHSADLGQAESLLLAFEKELEQLIIALRQYCA